MNSAEHETDEIERSGTDCIKRVCVIGAGPSGLTCLRALQKLDEQKFEVICYERYDSIGGEWNFKWALFSVDYFLNTLQKETKFSFIKFAPD